MSDTQRKRTKAPRVEDYDSTEVLMENCGVCGQLFVANAVSPTRTQCYDCKAPYDPVLFTFRPVKLKKKPEPPPPKRRAKFGPRGDAMRKVLCWCGSTYVLVSERLVSAGKTKSCGIPSCRDPEGGNSG